MFTESPQEFIDNSSIGIHAVSPKGIIIYANLCELNVLGYTKSQYVGHHVSEFQIDGDCLSEMMLRLGRLETLSNFPARVQGKDGIKYIIYNSSVYDENGEFKHTRCYGTEVEKFIYDAFMKHFNFS
jgi:hypothetical protein